MTNGLLNAYHFFHGTLYFKGSQCARPVHIQNLMESEMTDSPFSLDGMRESHRRISDALSRQTVTNKAEAQWRLALTELADSIRFCEGRADAVQYFDKFSPTHDHLSTFMDVVEAYYKRIGLPGARSEIFLVDELPAPYTGRTISVLAADKGDQRNHGIVPGFYFLKESVKPVKVNYLIAHEAVHAYLGKLSPYDVGEFFEEGLADLLSIFGCMRELMGPDVSRNLFLLFRLTSASGLIWDSYVDGTRSVLSKVIQVGLPAVIQAMTEGRGGLRTLEEREVGNLLTGSIGELEKSAISLLLDFPRHHVVSAEAYLLAQHLRDGMAVAEAASLSGMSIELADAALTELDGHALITRRRDGLVVTKALCRRYVELRTLRYDFR